MTTKDLKNNNDVIENEENRAKNQAQSQLESIKEMFLRLQKAEENDDSELYDEINQEIEDNALSVEVVKQYEILLCWGGPACRIIGELSKYNEPETATLQYQDWFTKWTDYDITNEDEDILLRYAQKYYFSVEGE